MMTWCFCILIRITEKPNNSLKHVKRIGSDSLKFSYLKNNYIKIVKIMVRNQGEMKHVTKSGPAVREAYLQE